MSNNHRAALGSKLIETIRTSDGQKASNLAVAAIVDILHAVCVPGDEIAAERLLLLSKRWFVHQCDKAEAYQ